MLDKRGDWKYFLHAFNKQQRRNVYINWNKNIIEK